jgi:tetratricopeptide (TPR) repeat protein
MRSESLFTRRFVSIIILFWICCSALIYGQPSASLTEVQALQNAAEAFIEAKEPAKAAAEYQKIITAFPDSEHALDAQTSIALTYIRAGQIQPADTAVEQLRGYKGRQEYVQKAKQIQDAYWWAGRFEESNAVCQSLLAEFPTHPMAMSLQKDLTNAYINLGDTVQAARQLEILWSTYNGEKDFVAYAKQLQDAYWVAGKREESNAVCRRLLTEFPQHPMATLLRRDLVIASIQRGDAAEAETAMNELISHFSGSPEDISAVIDACWFYRQQGDYGKVLEIYHGLLNEHPESPRALDIERGIIGIYLEHGAKAMADARLKRLETVYAFDPLLPRLFNELGNDYRAQGYYADCLGLHESALMRNPDEQQALAAYAGMAKAQIQLPMAGGDPNGVEKIASKTVTSETVVEQLIADYAHVSDLGFHVFQIGEEYYFLGDKLVKEGKKEQGREAFQRAIDIWQNNTVIADRRHAAMAAYYSGVASGYLGDDAAALGYYQVVARDYPEYEKAWHARFMVAECAGKLASAGQVNREDAVAVQLAAYHSLLLNDPNCPVSPIVRHKIQSVSR